jgi:hypothetical protein
MNEIVKANEFLPADTQQKQAGELAAIQREDTELKAQILVAQHNPRNEYKCYEKIIKACERSGLAAEAEYSFPRGKSKVTGPSVKLARALRTAWGNIRSGFRIVSMDDEMIHVRGYAHDMETNSFAEAEIMFAKKKHGKGNTYTKTTDERAITELINKHGAKVERNAILQILPPDVIDDAVQACRKTRIKVENKQLTDNRGDTLKKLVVSFSEFGVTQENLEEYYTTDLEKFDAEQIAELRTIYQSIKDGNSKASEYFGGGVGKKGEVSDLSADIEEPNV